MATQWKYKLGNEELGPVTSRQLKQLAAAGKLKPDDLVWNEELGKAVSTVTAGHPFETDSPAARDGRGLGKGTGCGAARSSLRNSFTGVTSTPGPQEQLKTHPLPDHPAGMQVSQARTQEPPNNHPLPVHPAGRKVSQVRTQVPRNAFRPPLARPTGEGVSTVAAGFAFEPDSPAARVRTRRIWRAAGVFRMKEDADLRV